MNQNVNVQTFSEDRFKGLKILLIILVPIILLFALMFLTMEQNENALSPAEFLPIIGGVFLFFILLTFLILSLQRRKTVKCTPEGFRIQDSTFWSTSDSSELTKWSEVSDTNIALLEYELGTVEDGTLNHYSFHVETNEYSINLLDLKTSSKKTIRELINYVNNATPHLKNIWLPNSQIGNKQPLDSAYKFSKVAR